MVDIRNFDPDEEQIATLLNCMKTAMSFQSTTARRSDIAGKEKDLNQAVTWLDKAIAQNSDGYFIYYQKARALAKLGKKQDAIAASNKSIELAKAAKNDDYVTLNEKL